MIYTSDYDSELVGKILLACDNDGLTGLWFYGQKYFAEGLVSKHNGSTRAIDGAETSEGLKCFFEHKSTSHRIIDEAKRWLDIYFAGGVPDFTPPLSLKGTRFQMRVWDALKRIPYGHTTTYKAIADEIHCRSSQAVGGAVGHNPISIILPCHRVISTSGSLTGYSAGLDKKEALLHLEGAR